MNEPYPIVVLLVPTLSIFLATLIVVYAVTRAAIISIAVAAIKSGIFVFYFSSVFDGTFTVLDDQTYVAQGIELFNQGIGLFNFLNHLPVVKATSGHSDVVFYPVYNAQAFRLFGATEYFAPVALNLILISVMSYIGYQIVKSYLGLNDTESKFFFFFLLFQPDILVLSNFLNIKDVLVLILHVVLLLAVAQFYAGKYVLALLAASVSISVLVITRFYVPVFFAATLVLVVFTSSGGFKIKATAVAILIAISAFVVHQLGSSNLQFAIDLVRNSLVNPFYGFVRFLLTPIPFNTDAEYAFLDIPAVFHWLLMPFLVLGAYQVWMMATSFSRFLVLYFLVFLGVYASIGDLQGPRQRVQLDFAIAAFQFMGMLTVYKWVQARRMVTKTQFIQ